MISRWPCYSDWSFFGGKGLNPVLWTKRVYSGDVVVEMYAHNQMDLPKEIAYSRPGDLNITIAGDGKNLESGYSFVVAGWNNTKTRLFRGAQVVAENTSENARFPRPINHNFAFHKRWYYVRAEARRATKDGREGMRLSLSVDDVPLLEYFDPSPLPTVTRGGRVALWTVDSTIMVARAKIESASMGARSLPSGLMDAVASPAPVLSGEENHLTPRPLLSDGMPSAVVERINDTNGRIEGPVWSVRNPTAGGLFAVRLARPGDDSNKAEPWQVTRETRLELDLTLPPEVKIDLYAKINGVQHLIALTGAQRPDARARMLGNGLRSDIATAVAADEVAGEREWRHVSFELGEALQKLYPNVQSWNIEELALGALHGDEYRWLGFHGNPLGASYRLHGVRLTN